TRKQPLTSPATPIPGPARPTLTTTDTNPRDRRSPDPAPAAQQTEGMPSGASGRQGVSPE
ncbi:hypothetical protein AB0N23_03715, partial [Streptomyces sp. NPDC052644]